MLCRGPEKDGYPLAEAARLAAGSRAHAACHLSPSPQPLLLTTIFLLSLSLQHIRNTLQQSREQHKSAVQERIDSVGDLNDVVSLTKALFALSKVRHRPSFAC